jgi:hypothetical protein
VAETATGVKQVSAEVPSSFQLSQNYPNPFNPTKTIKYQISGTGKVVLKVFDILGKEVAALVNETKEAGSYKATFNASTLSSGVYFNTLKAGNFISTKKMMYLK